MYLRRKKKKRNEIPIRMRLLINVVRMRKLSTVFEAVKRVTSSELRCYNEAGEDEDS
jgi:hypothetical protein